VTIYYSCIYKAAPMTALENLDKYLPLSEATYYIMLALVEPRHGYAVMQKVDEITRGTVKIGPGTLYGAFLNLEKQGLIVKVDESRRRKSYALTSKGRKVLLFQLERLGSMIRIGADFLNRLSTKQ
jgi:DNA-binding PadR family transcriptional regulator